ncbi:NUDIX hydrolase [Pseudonocardia spinosispora]|uniref:NUDIX hydrolase n=1 Tax=Pseudonocardia spinosispora TaxID=103441 RepID=UPI0006847C5D|nr:NUDIX domain-containing protein [Pseudonocardia spinosispora]
MTDSSRLVACVGAIVHDREGRLLLIKRGQEPGKGRWSFPGGRVEQGETDHQAVRREVAEETGLRVRPVELLARVRRPAPNGDVFDIAEYRCELDGPSALTAATDAEEARWVTANDYAALPMVEGLTELLAEWRLLPRADPSPDCSRSRPRGATPD